MVIQNVPLNIVKDGGMFSVGLERNLCVITLITVIALPDPGF